MKKPILSALVLFIGMPLCQAQFSADLVNVKKGNKTIYQLQSDGTSYRYDFEEIGMKGIVIVNPEKGKTAILMPQQKIAMKSAAGTRMSMDIEETTEYIINDDYLVLSPGTDYERPYTKTN
ncbi:MAG TPA: hypothetical protein VFC41_04570 [Anaerovoracaceae bacterium]|nr:hypothetical protein [Anaerovoracaceae bacterium]